MRRLTTDEFIQRAIAVHGDEYDYSKVNYHDMHTNVVITCRKHGDFLQMPCNHLKGYGCMYCHKIDGRKLDVSLVLSRFKEVHGDKYDYSLIQYKNSKTKIKIICPVHGVFKQIPEKHMKGHGCPKCCSNHKADTQLFIEKARRVHGDLYDYSCVEYVNSLTPVCIIDKEYGMFWQRPDAHVRGEGHWARRSVKIHETKKRNGSYRISKPERKMYSLLVDKFGVNDVFSQYKCERYPFVCDFYIKSLDLFIELNAFWTHGCHWFDSCNLDDLKEVQRIKEQIQLGKRLYNSYLHTWTVSDVKKRNIAKQNNLNYLVFWDNDLSDFYVWYNRI